MDHCRSLGSVCGVRQVAGWDGCVNSNRGWFCFDVHAVGRSRPSFAGPVQSHLTSHLVDGPVTQQVQHPQAGAISPYHPLTRWISTQQVHFSPIHACGLGGVSLWPAAVSPVSLGPILPTALWPDAVSRCRQLLSSPAHAAHRSYKTQSCARSA